MNTSVPAELANEPGPAPGKEPDSRIIRIPEHMLAALRSDHAGEAGAVQIYRGILALTRDDQVREFARHHLATEQRHLQLIEEILPAGQRSRLLPLCRWAGWMTGALPAMFGQAPVYRTIDAVESFVDEHYREQIDQLDGDPEHCDLRDLLERCRADEIAHRDDARARLDRRGILGKLWSCLVGLGSRAGVSLVMRV